MRSECHPTSAQCKTGILLSSLLSSSILLKKYFFPATVIPAVSACAELLNAKAIAFISAGVSYAILLGVSDCVQISDTNISRITYTSIPGDLPHTLCPVESIRIAWSRWPPLTMLSQCQITQAVSFVGVWGQKTYLSLM
jgi:hypothetical protein